MKRSDILCIVFLWLVGVGSVSAGENAGPWLLKMPDHGYLSTELPTKWEEGLLTGNGTLGALAMGSPWKERIILSHEKLFLPKNPPTGAPDLGGNLERFRELIFAGKAREAALLTVEVGKKAGIQGMVWTNPFVPACQMEIEGLNTSPFDSYCRSIDYETAEATTAWTTAKGQFRRSVFASRKDGIIVTRFCSPDGARSDFKIRLAQLPAGNEKQQSMIDGLIEKVNSSVTNEGVKFTTHFRKKWKGSLKGYTVETRIAECDGSVRVEGDWLCLKDCSRWRLHTDISLSRELPVSTGTSAGRLLEMDYEALLGRHAAIQKEVFNRFSLCLADEGRRQQTTRELLQSSSFGNLGNRLVVELCEAARYLRICSTGELPPTLQGIWGGTWTPPWSCDFTQNGNVPSVLEGGLCNNFPEVIEAYADYMWSLKDDFRDNARDLYGAPGIFVPSRTSDSGKTYHYSAWHPHLFWNAGGAWASQFFYDYWQYTGDERFLKEKAIPFMLASAEFLSFILTRDEEGKLMFVPCYSPENAPPGGRQQQMTINATMDVAAAKQLFRNLIRLAELGYIENPKTKLWKEIVSGLPPYAVDESGDLKEWIWPAHGNNNRHRHASHLYPLFYEVDPDFKKDPRLRAAAVTAIENRLKWRRKGGGNWEMAFGLVQLGLAAAHLADTPHAYECVDALCNFYWSPSFTSYHNPGAIFNVDICGGLPALVTEMILQSSADEITLLPALPQQWPSGEVRGVRTRCGAIVDFSWKKGKPVAVVLRAQRKTSFRLRYRDRFWSLKLEAGQEEKIGVNAGPKT